MPAEETLAEYGQNLPYSLEAEQSVLGSILIDPEKLPDVMNVIKAPGVFYTRQHQELYALMVQMFSESKFSESKPIDYVTLLEESQRAEVFENSQNAKTYLLHLMELVPTTENLSRYCEIVVEKYYLRNLLSAATDIASSVREADGDAASLLDAAEQKIYDIRQGRQSADLTPISAVFSLEMSNPQLVSRMLSSDASITSDKLRTGHLDAEEWSRLAVSAQRLSAANIYFDDSAGITVSQIKAKLRRLKNLGLVIIDYLQLMGSGSRIDNRVQEVSMITRSLKIMAEPSAGSGGLNCGSGRRMLRLLQRSAEWGWKNAGGRSGMRFSGNSWKNGAVRPV